MVKNNQKGKATNLNSIQKGILVGSLLADAHLKNYSNKDGTSGWPMYEARILAERKSLEIKQIHICRLF
jgi:hypothetical protein